MKKIRLLFLLLMTMACSACAKEQTGSIGYLSNQSEEIESTEWEETLPMGEGEDSQEEVSAETQTVVSDEDRVAQMKELYGEYCIADQTFEVELSEYEGKVHVVPYAPSTEKTRFSIDIVQDGEVLNSLWDYTPEAIEGEMFTSLDAIAFFDINFDDCTDIVLIQTYGDMSFAAVYKGFVKDVDEYERYFYVDSALSKRITEQLEILTIPSIRELVTEGKKNGEFASYQEAYKTRSRVCEMESNGGMTYGLIYFDEDEVPELVASVDGYWVSVYTYKEGNLYTLMDQWGYGAGGNAGYEYSPKKNSLRNYNADFAGLLLYTTYMKMTNEYTLDTVVTMETYNFDDANGNGMPDQEEEDSFGKEGATYINGVEVTDEECVKYDIGEYEYIFGSMSYEEILCRLNG